MNEAGASRAGLFSSDPQIPAAGGRRQKKALPQPAMEPYPSRTRGDGGVVDADGVVQRRQATNGEIRL